MTTLRSGLSTLKIDISPDATTPACVELRHGGRPVSYRGMPAPRAQRLIARLRKGSWA